MKAYVLSVSVCIFIFLTDNALASSKRLALVVDQPLQGQNMVDREVRLQRAIANIVESGGVQNLSTHSAAEDGVVRTCLEFENAQILAEAKRQITMQMMESPSRRGRAPVSVRFSEQSNCLESSGKYSALSAKLAKEPN